MTTHDPTRTVGPMEAAFLADILEHPDDDAPRLIYADWLDDDGRPARAEFIRVQCELARLSPDDARREKLQAREAELLRANERSWAPNNRLTLFFKWRRGFVAVLDPCARGVFDGEDSLKILAEFPLAEELEFGFCMGDDEFRHMPDLPNLKVFGVGGNVRITSASIARVGRWRTLRSLRLNGREITDDALPHLTSLAELRVLDLSWSAVTDEGLTQLRPLASLEELDLSDTGLTGRGFPSLAALPRLKRLNVTATGIWDVGIGDLVGCSALEELRLGSFHQNGPLGDDDLEPLLQMPSLRYIDLGTWCEPSEDFIGRLRQALPHAELWYNGERRDR